MKRGSGKWLIRLHMAAGAPLISVREQLILKDFSPRTVCMQIVVLIISEFYLLNTAAQRDVHSEVFCQDFVRIVGVAICI